MLWTPCFPIEEFGREVWWNGSAQAKQAGLELYPCLSAAGFPRPIVLSSSWILSARFIPWHWRPWVSIYRRSLWSDRTRSAMYCGPAKNLCAPGGLTLYGPGSSILRESHSGVCNWRRKNPAPLVFWLVPPEQSTSRPGPTFDCWSLPGPLMENRFACE